MQHLCTSHFPSKSYGRGGGCISQQVEHLASREKRPLHCIFSPVNPSIKRFSRYVTRVSFMHDAFLVKVKGGKFHCRDAYYGTTPECRYICMDRYLWTPMITNLQILPNEMYLS